MLRAVSPICCHNLRIMLKNAGFAVAVSHWPQAMAVGVWGGFGSSRSAPPCRPRAVAFALPPATVAPLACGRLPWLGVAWRSVGPGRGGMSGWRPAAPCQPLGTQQFAKRLVLPCRTARFALPNGPFQGAIRAVRQPHSGRLGSQGANSGSGAEQKRHFCFRLQTFLLNLHEISSAQPPGSRSGPQAGSVHRGGAACKPKCDEE